MTLPFLPTSGHSAGAPRSLNHWHTAGLCLLAGALATACGGGGDSVTTTAAPALVFEKANMESVARKANDSFALFDLAIFAGDYMLWGNDWFTSGKAYRCQADDPNSGSVIFTSSRPGGRFQAGDTLTVQYSNCQQDAQDPERTTGKLVLKILAVSGDPASEEIGQPWSYQANVQYLGLTMQSPDERTVIDGEIKVTESSPGILNEDLDERITTSFETASIRLTEDADVHEYSQASGTLLSNHTPDNSWTATIGTTLTSTALNGKLSFTTQTQFEGALGNPFPTKGSGRIQAANLQQINLLAKPTGVQGTLSTPQAAENFFIEWAKF